MRLAVSVAVVFSMLISVGCGSKPTDIPQMPLHPFSGIVQVDGKPVSGAQVVLHPRGQTPLGVVTPNGQTDEAGRFVLTTYKPADGAPEGAYQVTVSWADVENPGSSEPDYGPEKLPRKYQHPDLSGLELEVRPDVAIPPVLELTEIDDSPQAQPGFIND